MGVKLALYALGPWWAHLDQAPRTILAYMAASTLDTPKDGQAAGRFYKSRAEIVLNYAGITESDPRYESTDRRVRRHIATLIEAGAIRQLAPGRRGRHAEYELLVDPLRLGQDLLPGTELGGPRTSRTGGPSGPS